MNKLIFREIAFGFACFALGAYWGLDPDAHSYLLFFAGIGILVGSTKRIVNKEIKGDKS